MDNEDRDLQEAPKEPVKWATPVQRLWAWVGVAYVLLLLGLNTYALTTGEYLTGIGSLGVIPALVGLGVTVILRFRQGKGRGGLAVCVLLAGACFLIAVVNLIRGLPLLLAQL